MKFLTLLSVLITFVSCQSTSKTSGMNTDQLVTLICNCAQPIVAYNDELKALAAADNMGALSQKMTHGDRIMDTGISCITDQIEKDTKDLLNDNLSVLINERCDIDPRMAMDLIQKVADFEFPIY